MPTRSLTALACSLLIAVAETVAFAPRLHGCALAWTAAGGGRSAVATTAVGAGGGHGATAEGCAACQLAGLVLVVRAAAPIAAPVPRVDPAVRAALPRPPSVQLDRACGRSPPSD